METKTITTIEEHPDTKTLFDAYGRPPPFSTAAPVHQETRRWFICKQPEINYAEIYARISTHLGKAESLTAQEFEQRAKNILDRLKDNPRTKNILAGAHVPFFLPKATPGDIGQALDTTYLPAAEHAFQAKFPDYTFVNHHKSTLSGKLSIATGSRHEKLVENMNKEDVVGYYFPCLLEYSLPAAVEQVQMTPGEFLLAGGFDTCAAFTGSPDLLLNKEGYPPLLWLAALNGEKEGIGYHFEAYGHNLTFNRRAHLGQAAEYWASGLVALG